MKLGLIAGNGRFPFLLLDAARAQGFSVAVAAIREETDPEIDGRAAAITGRDVRVSAAGESGALVFLFFVVAPAQEAGKVAAAWPAFLSKHFDEPYDGVVYASASALGFAAVENGYVLHAHPVGGIWIARALVALPAHVFFACLWGYALGRAKQCRTARPQRRG